MALDKLLKRHFWAVILSLVAVAAFFDAQGIMQVVGASLGADAKQLAAPPLVSRAVPTSSSGPSHATGAEPILHRNPFDSVTGPLDVVASAEVAAIESAQPLDMSDPYGAPPCEGVQVLVIAASADPDWSFAAMETPKDKGKSFLRRRGGDVDGKTVKFIGWDRVWLANGNQLCQSQMFKPPPGASASAPPPAAPMPAPAAGGAGAVGDDIKKGIQRVSANEFNVDRGVVDKILENQAELMRQARIVPSRRTARWSASACSASAPTRFSGRSGWRTGTGCRPSTGLT